MNCPSCRSQNVKCYRRKQEDSQSVSAQEILCVCQDCGYKYKQIKRPAPAVNSRPASAVTQGVMGEIQPKGALRWVFIILFWPVALSVWFYKTNKVKLEKVIKAAIIAVVWVLLTVVFGWLILRPTYDIPEIVFDRTVTEKRDVTTAQFATTTVPSTTVAPETAAAQTTTNSIFS